LELANRIAINDAVRPEAGGALWRIRDGMQAATQGPASDRTQISAFVSVLEEPQTFAAAAGLGSPVDMTSYAARMVADQQYVRVRAQDRMETLSAGAGAIEAARMSAQGVNLDEELQKLVSIEQAYAANSQVIRSLGEMLDTLLRAF
jgi:flagellar hook-associated protein 1 FlgK